MTEGSNESIFRKESLERVNSPDELNDYIRVTGPRAWMVLSAIVILLSGFIVWGSFGWVESSVPASVEVKGGQAMCYLSSQNAGEIETERAPGEEKLFKLAGQVELKNVTFGYSRLGKPLIENFSMKLTRGMSVALVGASGCGKSTIAGLIAGPYKPWSGEILFDGRPMSGISRHVFTASLSVVDQDITIFADTIANNIRMWDRTIDDQTMVRAAMDAQIHEDIMKREGGYRCMLSADGRDLSGGQRQRLEIARVLAQEPNIIILDEATSALDNLTQKKVSEALDSMHCTRLVIAPMTAVISVEA